jgi:hypothetical protein
MVIGSRFIRREDMVKIPHYKKIGIKTITKATHVISYNHITDAQGGFRAYNKIALPKMRLYYNGMSVSAEILSRAKEGGLIITEVPTTVYYPKENKSTKYPIFHGVNVLSSVIQFIAYRRPLIFFIFPSIVLLMGSGFLQRKHGEYFLKQDRYLQT